MEPPSQQPQDQQNCKDCPKHQSHLTPERTGYPEVRSCTGRGSCLRGDRPCSRGAARPLCTRPTAPLHSASVCDITCSFQFRACVPLPPYHLSRGSTREKSPVAPLLPTEQYRPQDRLWAYVS